MQQLELAFGWLASRLALVHQDERGLSGVEYLILVAVIGAVMLAGATLFGGAITSAWGRLVTLVNSVG
jgi:Flp pilus assembly pilin Flp